MISIICVYNDEKILEECLLKSLKSQTQDHELILLDNRKDQFESAARALNHGAVTSKGKYLMFVHQDVAFLSDHFLEYLEKTLETLPNLGIAGVAGKRNRRGVITNIKHGVAHEYAGKFQIEEPQKVQTLDEVLTIIPRIVFEKLKFDEETCDNWHLYVVDYCLSVKELGLNSYVIPCKLYHKSNATTRDENYYLTLEKLLKKHRNSNRIIYTTMGNWITTMSLKYQRKDLWRFLDTILEN